MAQARSEQFIVYPPKKAGRSKINAFNQSIKLRLTALSITHLKHILKPLDIFYNEHNLRLASPLYVSRHNRGSDVRWSLCFSVGNGFLSDHNGGNTLPTDWRAGDHNKIYFKLMTI